MQVLKNDKTVASVPRVTEREPDGTSLGAKWLKETMILLIIVAQFHESDMICITDPINQ